MDKLVIILIGYTKCRKSTISRLIQDLIHCNLIEMSTAFRKEIDTNDDVNLDCLLSALTDYREKYGQDALANNAIEMIYSSNYKINVIVGIRSINDYKLVKDRFQNIYTIYLHSTSELRHQRLTNDPTSIAKGSNDYSKLDNLTYEEGIRHIIKYVDDIIVNESGFPLSPLEQLLLVIDRIKNKYNLNQKYLKESIMNSDPVIINKLPVFSGNPGDENIISRVKKSKGEFATLSISPSNYIAYVEFPLDGEPRANHYHEEKQEYLYLIKGKVKLYYRRGGQPDDAVIERIIEEGTLVYIQPGFAHAYLTIEEGHAIEFSSTTYDIIKKDKIRDYVIKK